MYSHTYHCFHQIHRNNLHEECVNQCGALKAAWTEESLDHRLARTTVAVIDPRRWNEYTSETLIRAEEFTTRASSSARLIQTVQAIAKVVVYALNWHFLASIALNILSLI